MKKWFGVRTLFLISVARNKKKVEKYYSNSSVLFEERVILYHSNNIETAIRLAEKDAKKYESEHINPYGEKVKCKYLNMYDTFELFDDPADRVEVFSASDVYLSKKDALKSAHNRFGPTHVKKVERVLRKKFQHE